MTTRERFKTKLVAGAVCGVLLGILAVLAYLLYEQRKERERLENAALSAPALALAPDRPDSASTPRRN